MGNTTTQTADGKPVERNIVDSALAAGKQLGVKIFKPDFGDAIPFIILTDAAGNEKVHLLSERFERPARKVGNLCVDDMQSFLKVWELFAEGDSQVYGSLSNATFTAVFDEHGEHADFREHRATFQMKHSPEWLAWFSHSKQAFAGNTAFAHWLQDHLSDVVQPEGARLMEIALTMRVTANASWSNLVKLQNGHTELTYTNVVEGTSVAGNNRKLPLPEEFELSIPVWAGYEQTRYTVKARFSYRLNGAALSVMFELIEPRRIIELAFKDTLEAIENGIKKPVIFGTP